MQTSITKKLVLMQLADSFFPTGSFTLSHGLEALVQENKVRSIAELLVFIELLLRNKVGTTDVVALLHSYEGCKQNDFAAIVQADRLLFVQTAIAKQRETQRQSGRALLMVASGTWQDERLVKLNQATAQGNMNCLHPVIFGAISAIVGLEKVDAAISFLHGLVTSILGAAIRLGVLGHLQAQQALSQLASVIEQVWLSATSMSLEQMWSGIPSIEMAQMQHPELNQRLFAN